MQDQPAISELGLPQATQTESIPRALKEFGNFPPKSVSAWVAVRTKDLPLIALEGIRVVTTEKENKDNKVGAIFEEEAAKAQIGIKRRNCIFASPLPPEKTRHDFVGDDGDTVLEVKVDPDSDGEVLVADGTNYTEAQDSLKFYGEAQSRTWAEKYWRDAVPLQKYTDEQKRLDASLKSSDYDYKTTFPPNAFGFEMPEILIPAGIPATRIRAYTQNNQ